MTKNFISYLVLVFVVGFCGNVYSQQTAKKIDGIGYLEYLPPGYNDSPNEKFPVIIFLHGLGERGDGSPSDLNNKVAKWGPPKHIKNGHNMCFNVDGQEKCFIVISPQLPGSVGMWHANYINTVVDHVLNSGNYKVDKSQVYLTGLSLGGGGVWSYAYSSYNDPNQFAAIAPVAGWGSTNKGCTISERKMAVWGFHGDQDGTVAYSKGLDMFNAVKNCSDPNPTAALKFTTYQGVGHNSWTRAYETDHSVHNPNLYEWLLKRSLNTSGARTDEPPVANAGSDINVEMPVETITINGSGNSSNSPIDSYSWQKVSGPAATLINKNSKDLSVAELNEGTYKFRLTVTADNSLSDSDDVLLTVEPEPVIAEGSWLEVTSKNAGGKSIYMFYNSNKDNGIDLPVIQTGNDNITFKLKTISGSPDWNDMELGMTANYQRRYITIGDYVNQVGSNWVQVTIPLSDFDFDLSRLLIGVSNIELKMRYGFGNTKFGLDEIEFSGGTSDVVWYGDTHAESGDASAIIECPELYISGRKNTDTPTPNPPTDPDPPTDPEPGDDEGSWLEVTSINAGGKSIYQFYNNKKDNGVDQHVTQSGNNKVTFMLKNIVGSPNWNKMEFGMTANYQRKYVTIGNYINQVGTDWVKVTIPLTDFNFDAYRIAIGISNIELKMRYGFGSVKFGLDEIKFIGGSQEFVWYGDSYAESGDAGSIIEGPKLYISNRNTQNSSSRMASTRDENNNMPSLAEEKSHEEKKVEVFDMHGRKVKDLISMGVNKSEIIKDLQLKGGMYIIRVHTNMPELKSFKILMN